MKIKVIAVGGTIDKVYFDAKSEFQVGEPQIKEVFDTANVTFKYSLVALIAKDSLDMTDHDRQIIHDYISNCDEELILVTHGTDTMVDTARYLTDIKGKTIVLTGAMQPARMKTSDAVFNIGTAVGALQSLPHGAYVAMNGNIFQPEEVRKNVEAGKFEKNRLIIEGYIAGSLKLTGKIAEIAKKMLKDTAAILDNCEIDYVLEAGTLLGVVRENRLLPWDNDVDITITKQFQDQLLKNRWRFWLKGYRTRVKYYTKDTGPFKKGEVRMMKLQKLVPFRKLNLVDIFIKKLIDEEYFWTIAPKRPVLKSVPRKYYEEFTRLKVDGYDYMAPKDYEGFLTYCYGDWKVVVKDWNFRTGDNCVCEEIE